MNPDDFNELDMALPVVDPLADAPTMESLRNKFNSYDSATDKARSEAFLAGKALPNRENFYWQSETTQEAETESPPYVRQTLRIDARASYDALVAYMNSIENASPLVDFISLKLSPDEDRSRPLKVEVLTQVTHSLEAISRWRELQALAAPRP